jgi:hypothetical protein
MRLVSSRAPFEGPPCLLEGLGMGEGREQAAQCFGMTPTSPHRARTAPAMAAQWRTGRTVPGSDSREASGDRRGEDSTFDHGARGVTRHLMLQSGERTGSCEAV